MVFWWDTQAGDSLPRKKFGGPDILTPCGTATYRRYDNFVHFFVDKDVGIVHNLSNSWKATGVRRGP